MYDMTLYDGNASMDFSVGAAATPAGVAAAVATRAVAVAIVHLSAGSTRVVVVFRRQ